MGQRSLFEQADGVAAVGGGAAFLPLSALLPAPGPARARGIARLAAAAPKIDARNDVEYRDLPCRSLVSHCDSTRMPFEFTINPYRGCEFGCVYCYARYTHEYMELREWEDFERQVFVKRGAREALLEDLRRVDFRGRWIAIGTATDPYQPVERRERLTRSLLEVFAGRRNLRLSITTKSDLVMRDVDLLRRICEHSEVHVNITITTPHHRLARRTEPRAPRPERRLLAVRTLAEAGIPVGVFLMPLLPRVNDRSEDLELLVRLCREAGAQYFASQVLMLRSSARKRFFPWLEERFPELVPYYRRLYGGSREDSLAAYSRQKGAEIQALKQRFGLLGHRRDAGGPGVPPDQLELAW